MQDRSLLSITAYHVLMYDMHDACDCIPCDVDVMLIMSCMCSLSSDWLSISKQLDDERAASREATCAHHARVDELRQQLSSVEQQRASAREEHVRVQVRRCGSDTGLGLF